jgi:GrpB-like predicted nucleotidyltransferase (UPF0157 family)
MTQIHAPDPGWPALFELEATRWRAAGVEGLIDIHHIGSTAVAGLPAKPIIDMLPVFSGTERLEQARAPLEALGYDWMGPYGLPARRYCRRDDPESGTRLFHAHCYVIGAPDIDRHLAFRDALRGNGALRAGYSAVKGRCAALHPGDAEGYGPCKSDWIAKVEARALADATQLGQRPAPSLSAKKDTP